jgi:tetratricopeptide (TPR) repeat protein
MNKNLLKIFLITLTLLCVKNIYSQQEPVVLLSEGIRSVEARDYPDAVNFLTQYLASYPNDAQANYNRAVAYYYLQQYDNALTDANTAITANMNYKNAYDIRGMIKTKMGNYDDAVSDFTYAINIDPDFWDAYINRASANIGAKNYSQALSDLNYVITNDNQNLNAYMLRGEAYMLSGMNSNAISDFDTVLASQPDAKTFMNRGVVNFNLSKYQDAITDFQNAMKLDPTLSEELNSLIEKAQEHL